MCLAADVPLVESGSAGYLGQVAVIRRGVSECYECQPKPPAKQYPVCTIRNTPSAPIHCIVWAKYLFSQLFGEADAENDVTPDPTNMPPGEGSGSEVTVAPAGGPMAVCRKTTRAWTEENNYNAEMLFRKLFHDDIKTLLTMDKLWQKRQAPVPVDEHTVFPKEHDTANGLDTLAEQRLWTAAECRQRFLQRSLNIHRRCASAVLVCCVLIEIFIDYNATPQRGGSPPSDAGTGNAVVGQRRRCRNGFCSRCG